jgi:hypothetical protein
MVESGMLYSRRAHEPCGSDIVPFVFICRFLPLLLRVIKTSHDDQLRTWAAKAFGTTHSLTENSVAHRPARPPFEMAYSVYRPYFREGYG